MLRTPKSPPRWLSALLFVGVWTLLGFIFSALSYAETGGESRPARVSYALSLNLSRFYLWAALSLIIFRLAARFPVEFRPLRIRNLLVHVPALCLIASVHQLMHLTVGWWLEPTFRQHFFSLTNFYRAAFVNGLYPNVLIGSLIYITAHALLYYRSYRAAEAQQSLLQAELAQAQLQALKMQLHPHFLFNTLHSISSLVLEDPPKAGSMIARLGDFLRLTLEHSEEQVVTLKQELEFLRCYLEIEQVRFADRLTVDFQIEPTTRAALVPHLILQPVVENAIRHAIAPRAADGHIKVCARRVRGLLRLEVTDNGPGLGANGQGVEQRGRGLKNVRARLAQIYGPEFTFELTNAAGGGLTALLELPLRYESDGAFVAHREIL